MVEVKANISQSPAPSAAATPPYSTAIMRKTELASTPITPPPFGPSSAYAQTSQARNWRFSHNQLSTIRSTANAAARKRLSDIWAEEHASASSSTHLDIPFLSVSDEQALIKYYLVKVSQIVRAFGLPELVEATATTFVKRFYLRNTVMDFHPKSIVITCIFLASKAENYPLSLSEFSRKLAGKQASDPKVVEENRRTVLDLEFLVSQSLNFEYAVHGAHRAVYGLVLDIQALSGGVAREQAHKLAAGAHANLGQSRLTDAEFVYTPSQIALACVRCTEGDGKHVVTKWLDAKEARARTSAVATKAKRNAFREAETMRAAKAKIALARRMKGKAGAKVAEDELAAAASEPMVVMEFDDELLEKQPLGMSREELDKILDEIEELIKKRESSGFTGQGKGAEDVERVKDIDKRQKQCMNPEKVPGSRLFKKRQAEEVQGVKGEGGKRIKREDGVDSDDDEVPKAKDFSVKPEPQV
ncbi:related to Cyclin H [Melanopsichium pennsylvanicum]|uniref:Related to Cyclin H n=2 Tax=Melanopsichium pennsylvanicum TaxID=63383 RepID=A0AAJ4XMZ6_9BASI|nr:related to Cyclin H [Melanopsichium pennsylvanicum 4]SNX84761.1 related to Cyclin H [Melanopsichium pennsylvanicum]